MKKLKIYLLLLLVGGVVASCDMDKMPYDSIPEDEAFTTPDDFSRFDATLYSYLRSTVYGDSYTAPELQCDGFNAVTGFTGNLSSLYSWSFTDEETTVSTVYGNFQAVIANCNFIIDGYNNCDTTNTIIFTEEGKREMKNVKGDAFFMRAYSLYNLAQYFCRDYDESLLDQPNSGVSYRLDYNPSSDSHTYPARKTMRETYKQITNDIDSAAKYITREGEMGAIYVTRDAILALKARVALTMGEYRLAIQAAEELINGGNYWIAGSVADLEDMWHNDGTQESILQLRTSSLSELPLQTGVRYLPAEVGTAPDYIPTQAMLDYFRDDDFRKDVYFMRDEITTTMGTGFVTMFNKYEDRGKLYDDYQRESARFTVEPKLFRITEMYLIAAEAYYQLGETDLAKDKLNTVMINRFGDFDDENTADYYTDVMQGIKDERFREFMGEGMRLFDLKRWNDDVTRGTPQQMEIVTEGADGEETTLVDIVMSPGANTTQLKKQAGDNRFVWPIPRQEVDANPQVVQNPGY